jgi:hypothetical protein
MEPNSTTKIGFFIVAALQRRAGLTEIRSHTSADEQNIMEDRIEVSSRHGIAVPVVPPSTDRMAD